MRRFHDDQDFRTGEPCELSAGPSHHIARVLRMDAGDEMIVFNGRGGEWSAVIETVRKKGVCVRPLAFHDRDRTPALALHLALPLIKGERMDYALQKAAEMGAASVSLVRFQRNEVRLDQERMARKQSHWHGVLVSACEQCGLNRVPELRGPLSLAELVGDAAEGPALVGLAQGSEPDAKELARAQAVTLVTGPEGGLNEDETRACLEAGFQPVALGERTLRAETAPVALSAAVLTLAGAW